MRTRKMTTVLGILICGITVLLSIKASFGQASPPPPSGPGGLPAQLSQCRTNLTNCTSSLGTCNTNLSSCNTNLASCTANLQSTQSDLAQCNTSLEQVSEWASNLSVILTHDMFQDNGDGTFTDLKSGLIWETKTSNSGSVECLDAAMCPDPHNAGNLYALSTEYMGSHNGPAFTVFLAQLNDVAGGGQNCFAGYCDWRLPEVWELYTLWGNGHPANYPGEFPLNQSWSKTPADLGVGWYISYGGGGFQTANGIALHVRAVRR